MNVTETFLVDETIAVYQLNNLFLPLLCKVLESIDKLEEENILLRKGFALCYLLSSLLALDVLQRVI